MRHKLIHNVSFIILALLFQLLYPVILFSQEPVFSEKNLPDNSPATNENSNDNSKQNTEEDKSEPKKIQGKQQATSETPLDKTKSSIADILLYNKTSKAPSLMFDDEQNNNIERAIKSLKNNEIYTPDGNEEDNKLKSEDDKKKAAAEKAEQTRKKIEEENEKSYIYLASIIYFTPNDWAVWINDQKITSQTNKKERELYVKHIYKDRIKLLWKLSISKWKVLSGRKSESFAPKINANNQIEVEFDLKPNQTFILSTNNVVEGRAVIALLKKKEEERKVKVEADATQQQQNLGGSQVQPGQ